LPTFTFQSYFNSPLSLKCFLFTFLIPSPCRLLLSRIKPRTSGWMRHSRPGWWEEELGRQNLTRFSLRLSINVCTFCPTARSGHPRGNPPSPSFTQPPRRTIRKMALSRCPNWRRRRGDDQAKVFLHPSSGRKRAYGYASLYFGTSYYLFIVSLAIITIIIYGNFLKLMHFLDYMTHKEELYFERGESMWRSESRLFQLRWTSGSSSYAS
jgi:hypothetical protein